MLLTTSAGVAFLSLALSARATPIPSSDLLPRAGVKFHILSGTPPATLTGSVDDEKCTPAQVTAIKAGIVDAKKMADVAIKILKPKDMNKSNGFFWIFGGSQVSAAEITKKYDFVNKLDTPDEITTTAGLENSKTDLIFTCVPSNAPKSADAYANTVNIGRQTAGSNGVPTLNLIRLTQNSLANSESFVASAARVKASGDIKTSFPVTGGIPTPPLAFTLIHEVQHSDPLMDNAVIDHLVDVKGSDLKRAYGFGQIQNKLEASQKKLNPQNYAFFALLAESNPEFFAPDCFIGESVLGARSAVFARSSVLDFDDVLPAHDHDHDEDDHDDDAESSLIRRIFGLGSKKPATTKPAAPAKAPVKPATPPAKPAAPVTPPVVKPAAPAKPPVTPATPAKPPVKPVAVPSASKPSSAVLAKPSASAASTKCNAKVKGACAACQKIINGIPGDIALTNFDTDSS